MGEYEHFVGCHRELHDIMLIGGPQSGGLDMIAAAAVLDHLRAVTCKRVAILHQTLAHGPDCCSPQADRPEIDRPRTLLILGNVGRPALLNTAETARLPAEDRITRKSRQTTFTGVSVQPSLAGRPSGRDCAYWATGAAGATEATDA